MPYFYRWSPQTRAAPSSSCAAGETRRCSVREPLPQTLLASSPHRFYSPKTLRHHSAHRSNEKDLPGRCLHLESLPAATAHMSYQRPQPHYSARTPLPHSIYECFLYPAHHSPQESPAAQEARTIDWSRRPARPTGAPAIRTSNHVSRVAGHLLTAAPHEPSSSSAPHLLAHHSHTA